MTGDECQLAIQIDDKNYYVEGSDVDEHGDAHAPDGLCRTNRSANVKGVINRGVFMADLVELIPQ